MDQNIEVRSEFLQTLRTRGFINDCTDLKGLDEYCLGPNGSIAYVGYDATAQSLHVGHLVNIMMLRWFQKFGGQPITLVGGGTTRIGDPSFRSEARPVLSIQEINSNILSLRTVFDRYLSYEKDSNKALMVDNAKWLTRLNYLDFLRDFGKHFSINRMLSFESVKARLEREQSLSFLEFNYMLLQAYDFLELNRLFKCCIQIGGSDQWGNIVLGMEIISKINKKNAFGLTTPLLTTSTGKKMGKTEQGAVWIDQSKFSSYDFYQYWRNVDDADVEKLLLIFSDLEKQEIKKIVSEDINKAKKRLAYLVTADCHSETSAEEAENKAVSIFEKNISDNIDEIDFNIDLEIKIVEAITSKNLVSSKSEAKRLIEGGGIKLEDDQIKDINQLITKKDNDKILKIGKKKLFKLKFN
mgnify:CR=1 FL=1